MFLIVGLGNPGKKYENTRHNVGFKAIDEIATNFEFSVFSSRFASEVGNRQSIFNTKISKRILKDQKIFLIKPQGFMNNSGKTVKSLIKTHTFNPNNLIVIHDDIDLPIGKIRINKNRGVGGHRGIESIIKELKTKNFIRFRIGIKPATNDKQQVIRIEKFVLQKFSKEENEIIKKVTKKTIEAIKIIVEQGVERAMNKYNI